MKRYISYSEVSCFYEYGEDAYFQRYILGISEPKTEPLIFGSTVHDVLADKNYDWKTEIKNLQKFPQATYERIIGRIIKEVPTFKEHEKKLYVDKGELNLFAGIDAIDDNHIIEYKTGQAFWSQERADEHEQITHYIMCYEIETGKRLPCKLISINSLNGKHKIFETSRTDKQINEWYKKLINFKRELQNIKGEDGNSWWNNKRKFENIIQL